MTAKWWIGMTGMAVGAAIVLATVLSLLDGMSWIFDLIGNFRFQYVWIGAIALLALAWNRLWIPFGILMLAVLVNLTAVAPYWTDSVAAPAGEDRLTIVHLNSRASNASKDEVVDFVRDSQADIIFLAEVTPVLLDLLAEAELPYEPVAGTPPVTRIGILALARDASVTGQLTNLGRTEVPGVILRAQLGGETVEILGFHTTSPGAEGRASARDDQMAAAGALVGERDTPMILVGDFNATPWTGAFRDLIDAGLVDSQKGRGVAGSWPVGWGPLMIPIDHLLHTPELTTTSFAFGPSAGSDHRSLAVTLALAGG
ncbi:MAG: endonuclease/exonuclease/phosphatase family protein [Acidimicrobiia bacterium]